MRSVSQVGEAAGSGGRGVMASGGGRRDPGGSEGGDQRSGAEPSPTPRARPSAPLGRAPLPGFMRRD